MTFYCQRCTGIAFGPFGKNIHAPNEWVSLSSMEIVYEIYIRSFRENRREFSYLKLIHFKKGKVSLIGSRGILKVKKNSLFASFPHSSQKLPIWKIYLFSKSQKIINNDIKLVTR